MTDKDKSTGVLRISSRHGLNYADEREKDFVEKSLEHDREALIANAVHSLRRNVPYTIVFGDTREKLVSYDWNQNIPMIELTQQVLIAVADWRDTEIGEACVAEFVMPNLYYRVPTPKHDEFGVWVFSYEEDYITRDEFGDNHHFNIWRRTA